MSDVERELALERYKLLEPHWQNGRELRFVSKGSDVSFRTLQRWVAGYKREGWLGWSERAAWTLVNGAPLHLDCAR
jgi:putative transposase